MKASGFIAIFCSIGGPEPWTGGLPGGLIINIYLHCGARLLDITPSLQQQHFSLFFKYSE